MRTAFLFLPGLVLLSACAPAVAPVTPTTPVAGRWPEQVTQALPPGTPEDAVLQDSDGCYAWRDPAAPSGFSLVIGIDGRQLCDGRFPDEAAIEALAAEMRAEIAAGNTDIADTPPPQ
jgi:hypothetical protein